MKKKLTLNQTWILCLRMWRWIAKVWQTKRYKRYNVYQLKTIWLRKKNLRYLRGGCPFCAYRGGNTHCLDGCPGSLVDSHFNCCDTEYEYAYKPVEFYKELLRLNRIRKAKK